MLKFFSPLEKILIVVLSLIVVFTGFYLVQRYRREHSKLVASDGGIFTEGLVGKPLLLDPVFLGGNPIDRDITQLLFSGLTRYNPHSGLIEDDLATSERSKDNLQYTFTILPDAQWQDGEPVTADDVIFTYETVLQNPLFPNTALKQAFSDVTVEKVTPRSVRFKLKRPYSFFLSNVTIGLLPKHLLSDVPPENLEHAEFHQNPVGTGPYKFASWTVAQETHEITLVKNDLYYGVMPKIQTVIFRVFPDQDSLLRAQNTLSGFRLPSSQKPEDVLSSNSRFLGISYFLPQYSALFFNTDSDMLVNKKVRFALSLATDTEEILKNIDRSDRLVNSPLLEAKNDTEKHVFDLTRANGALFDTQWQLPGKFKPVPEKKTEKVSEKVVEAPKPVVNNSPLVFELKASADSWISYKIDSVPKDSILLKKGSSKTIKAKKSLLFTTIGNAGGVQVSLNGVALKPLGKSGEVVRNVLLDKTSVPETRVETPPEAAPVPDLPQVAVVPEPTPVPGITDASELNSIRINPDGKRLVLRLVTAQDPPFLLHIAETIQKQWLKIGVKVIIESYPLSDLQEKIQKRDYDVLLFGQNLGYNLDAFPFWHSSQAFSGLNLSNFRSLEADNLLVDIRKTFDERTKQELLGRLKNVMDGEIPALFLLSPVQYYLVDSSVKNVQLLHLSSHSDRLSDLGNWYMKEDYKLNDDGFNILELLRWIFNS